MATGTSTPDTCQLEQAEREAVVQAFLAAIVGMGLKRAMRVTGVDRAANQRLRKGTAADVKRRTLDAMQEYLAL